MSIVSTQDRQHTVLRPTYRRPEWRDLPSRRGSNTWGYGEVRMPSVAGRERLRRSAHRTERSFDGSDRSSRARRRLAMVVGSPGVTLVSLVAVVLFMAAAPSMSSGQEAALTPSGTTTVTVGDGQSLVDVARSHVPGVPVGDAVAEIAALNDIDAVGGPDAQQFPDELVVPVY